MIYLWALCVTSNVAARRIADTKLPTLLTPVGGRMIKVAHDTLQGPIKPSFENNDILTVGPKFLGRFSCVGLYAMGKGISAGEKIVSNMTTAARRIIGGQVDRFEKDVTDVSQTVKKIEEHERVDEAASQRCQEALDRGFTLFQVAKDKLEQVEQSVQSQTEQIRELNDAIERVPSQINRIKEKIETQGKSVNQVAHLKDVMKYTQDSMNAMDELVTTVVNSLDCNAETMVSCISFLLEAMNRVEQNWSDSKCSDLAIEYPDKKMITVS